MKRWFSALAAAVVVTVAPDGKTARLRSLAREADSDLMAAPVEAVERTCWRSAERQVKNDYSRYPASKTWDSE